MHIVVARVIRGLLPALEGLRVTLSERADAFMLLVKTGRTHL